MGAKLIRDNLIKYIKKTWHWWLRLSIGVSLCLWILLHINMTQLKMLIFSIHSSWLVFSIMVCLGANFFSAVRLDCAIKEYSTSLWNTLRLFLIGSFVGIALPSSLGNDFYFIYYLKKQSCSLSKATTLIFLQRIFGLLLFLFIGIIYIIAKYKTASAMLGHFQLSTNNLLLYVIYGFIVVTVFGMFLLYSYPKYFNWLKSQWFNNQIWHTIQTISKNILSINNIHNIISALRRYWFLYCDKSIKSERPDF